jgi:hypothetical protein
MSKGGSAAHAPEIKAGSGKVDGCRDLKRIGSRVPRQKMAQWD